MSKPGTISRFTEALCEARAFLEQNEGLSSAPTALLQSLVEACRSLHPMVLGLPPSPPTPEPSSVRYLINGLIRRCTLLAEENTALKDHFSKLALGKWKPSNVDIEPREGDDELLRFFKTVSSIERNSQPLLADGKEIPLVSKAEAESNSFGKEQDYKNEIRALLLREAALKAELSALKVTPRMNPLPVRQSIRPSIIPSSNNNNKVVSKRNVTSRPFIPNNTRTKPKEQPDTAAVKKQITPVVSPVQAPIDEPVPLEGVNFISTTHMGAIAEEKSRNESATGVSDVRLFRVESVVNSPVFASSVHVPDHRLSRTSEVPVRPVRADSEPRNKHLLAGRVSFHGPLIQNVYQNQQRLLSSSGIMPVQIKSPMKHRVPQLFYKKV